MIGRRPRSSSLRSPWLVVAASASLVLGIAGLSASAQAQPSAPTAKAEPAPAAATEPESPPAAAAGSMARIRLTEAFLADLTKSGAQLVGTGATVINESGRTLEIPINATLGDGLGLAGGFAITVDGATTYNCPDISISTVGNALYCGKDGATRQVLDLGEPAKVTRDGRWTTRANIPLRITSERRADQMNNRLAREPFAAQDVIGDMDLLTRTLLRGWDGDVDPRTGCWIGYYAGDNSIWRGWAIQAMVNRLPKDVGISQYSFNGATGTLKDAASPAIAVGQRTPYMEGVTTGQSKRIVRGSQYDSDNFWDGPSYGCNTNPPFVVGQGLLDAPDVKAWRYDGGLRTTRNNPAGAARPQWWGHARQTDYDGATGNYSWTCRGLPSNRTSTDKQPQGDTWWERVSKGSGFFGDNSTDRLNPDAGRAPECRDLNMDGFTLTTRYSISKRGGLEARNDQTTYPRYCSVEGNPLVSCWQEIYPLWDRAWAFQNHVYASVMRANVSSNATVKVPASWSPTGTEMIKPIAWRITDGQIGGAWPKYIDSQGNEVDLGGIANRADREDWATVSPFTVPGTNAPFTVSGYGTPMGAQEMSFILTADTDGSWTWPVNARTGRELPRMQIKVTFRYVISNYDDGFSCNSKTWYDDAAFGSGRNNDSAGAHCIQGDVPTIWPLPESKGDYWKRTPDASTVGKDGKKEDTKLTVSFESARLTSCLNDNEIKIQDNSTKNAPNVGADFTWDIRLAGQVTSFSAC